MRSDDRTAGCGEASVPGVVALAFCRVRYY